MKSNPAILLLAAVLLFTSARATLLADEASLNSKRGDYILSRVIRSQSYRGSFTGNFRTASSSGYNNQSLLRNRRMILVPTSFYQGKDHVIAYNYRPVFVRGRGTAQGVGSGGGAEYTRLDKRNHGAGEVLSNSSQADNIQNALRYRLSEPAIEIRTVSAINNLRTLYPYPNSRKAAGTGGAPVVREPPDISTGTVPYRANNVSRDDNSGSR
jgi:hypothetical protein